MDAFQNYEYWRTSPTFDEATRAEVQALAGNENEIRERFTGDLEFGTAGLRGIVAAGTNRMNIYTVRRATQGMANYINSLGMAARGVAISFDSRHMSPEFADETALCFCANGIPVHIFPTLHATPILSFAVRYFGCVAGVNITASHNPPEYNGYKVYWEDGAQIIAPHDEKIIAEVNAITDFSAAKTMNKQEAVEKGLYQVIGPELDDAFLAEVKKMIKRPEVIEKEAANIRLVYTPLHGCGNIPVRRILKELGFTQVYVVPEQELPDGDFPTVSYPNPEVPEAYELALKLAGKVDADLVVATDPDADRFGCYIKTMPGRYERLTGNQSGCLLANYEIGSLLEKEGRLPEGSSFISTIVTSNLAGAVARKFGVDFYETLTGFKNICGKERELEESGRPFRFLFGFEESYGCTIGSYVRDKDSIAAAMAYCEMAAYYKTRGMTLYDGLEELYGEVGFYRDLIFNKAFKGLEGKAKMAAIMESLRKDPPKEMDGLKVLAVRDYLKDERTDTLTGAVTPTGLPSSNVLYFEMEDDSWFCVRPSGTEPKIKLYAGIRGKNAEEADAMVSSLEKELSAFMDRF